MKMTDHTLAANLICWTSNYKTNSWFAGRPAEYFMRCLCVSSGLYVLTQRAYNNNDGLGSQLDVNLNYVNSH